jgi:hypothetical protein
MLFYQQKDFKLKNLDKYYVEMSQNLNSKLTFEEKIVAYQKKLDEKSKLESEQKVVYLVYKFLVYKYNLNLNYFDFI